MCALEAKVLVLNKITQDEPRHSWVLVVVGYRVRFTKCFRNPNKGVRRSRLALTDYAFCLWTKGKAF